MTDHVLSAPVTVTGRESLLEQASARLSVHDRRVGSLAATTSTNERNQT